jgi:hypothetical protein
MAPSVYIPLNQKPDIAVIIRREEAPDEVHDFEVRLHARSRMWPYINTPCHRLDKGDFRVLPLNVIGKRFQSGYLFGLRGMTHGDAIACMPYEEAEEFETSQCKTSKQKCCLENASLA